VLPLAVAWLVAGALFFTLRLKFINFRAFGHAIQIVRGKYSQSSDPGDVSHFQALATALSATVGLGNIAGVAIAVSLGGPGATFWMIIAGFLGMTTKLVECTLGVMYREKRSDGKFMGGPMEYLSRGFAEKGWPRLGMVLAVIFSVLCIGGSFGGGNAFQVSQSLSALKGTIPFLAHYPWVYGLLITFFAGLVILGGIKRIAKTAEKIVPLMCAVYLLGAFYVILHYIDQVPAALGRIVSEAFTPQAGYGGFIGVLVMGFRRAAFSNEAGVGSAAIAHSCARTDIPIREGFVALLEPFIDTVVICTMTALVVILAGAYNSPAAADLIAKNQGAALTSMAFASVVYWFPYLLSVAVVLFAFSTMISWSYYGERCWAFLFGEKYSIYYKILFLAAAFLGSVTSAVNVLEFSDLMILAMAFPNLIGLYVLGPKVKKAIEEYKFC
jgi:AGCS family alanine or glycine:cation symporter